jgi:hypothetical protein
MRSALMPVEDVAEALAFLADQAVLAGISMIVEEELGGRGG